jgi:hypothetical protein
MSKEEVVKLFAAISALFPRDTKFAQADRMMVDMWQKMLADIPYKNAEKAVMASVSTSPFPPSISEIRDYATRLTAPKRMSADEAWGIAQDIMRRYGTRTVLKEGCEDRPPEYCDVTVESHTYRCVKHQPSVREYEAKRHCPPEVWDMLERLGYANCVRSDNPDVVRGQFMRYWSGHDTEKKEERVFGTIVPELLKALTGENWALLEDGE